MKKTACQSLLQDALSNTRFRLQVYRYLRKLDTCDDKQIRTGHNYHAVANSRSLRSRPKYCCSRNLRSRPSVERFSSEAPRSYDMNNTYNLGRMPDFCGPRRSLEILTISPNLPMFRVLGFFPTYNWIYCLIFHLMSIILFYFPYML